MGFTSRTWLLLSGDVWNLTLCVCFSADFMNLYFQVRSSQLDRSIKGLKEHFRKNSATSALHSPAVQTKRNETAHQEAS